MTTVGNVCKYKKHMSDKFLDPVQMAKDGLFAERKDGVVRIVNAITGEVVAVQSTPSGPPHPEDYVEVLLPTGKTVMVQRGLEAHAVTMADQPELQPFLVDLICQQMVEQGKGLAEICKGPGMPSYNTLSRWRRKHQWVAEALNNARIDRAELMRDKAVSTAEKAENPDFDGDKLRVETYKWAAGVDDSKFSPRAKVEANITVPTQLVIVTGIERGPVDTPAVPPETLERDVSKK